MKNYFFGKKAAQKKERDDCISYMMKNAPPITNHNFNLKLVIITIIAGGGLLFLPFSLFADMSSRIDEREAALKDVSIHDHVTESDTRQILVKADTYIVVDSPSRAYHHDPFYVYGTLYEKGEHLDIGSTYCKLHIYWSDGPSGEEFVTTTSALPDMEGTWRLPISVNHTEGTYPLFIEFRGQVFINGSIQEYDVNNDYHHDNEGEPKNMTRFPSNISLDIDVFYHSIIHAEISDTRIEAGEYFWLNGTILVYETVSANETGEPIADATMNITLDGKNVGLIETSDTGEFSEMTRLSNSTAPGPHEMRIEFWQFEFSENGQYGSSYTSFYPHFIQDVVISFSNTPLFSGEDGWINGTITDLRGDTLWDPRVPDKIYTVRGEIINGSEGDNYEIDEIEILNDTYFNMSFSLPKNFRPGPAVVKVIFDGDPLYKEGVQEKNDMIVTQSLVDIDPITFDSSAMNITGRITDLGGRGISVPLAAFINDTEIGTGNSENDGTFRFPVNLPMDVNVGTIEITVKAFPASFSLYGENRIEADVHYSAAPRCDLVVDGADIEIEYARPGDGSGMLNISFSVRNAGNVISAPTQIRFLSGPDMDKYIYLGELEPGEQYRDMVQWEVRDNISLTVMIDPEDIIHEILEDNNAHALTLVRGFYDLDHDDDNNYLDDDTDGDGFPDTEEVEMNSDPYDETSVPEYPEVEPENSDKNDSGVNPWVWGSLVVFMIVAIAVIVWRFRGGKPEK